jgi:DNA-binding winged helix-turn-helix (wHTH) protein/TolB-like protein
MITHPTSKYTDELYRLGEWAVCFDTCTVRKDSSEGNESIEVKITPRSMEVLKYLCDRPGEVISVTEMIAEVWGRSTCTDHLVHKAIAELRNALGDKPASPNYIKTVPKRGYIIIADLERSQSRSVSYETQDASASDGSALTRPVSAFNPLGHSPTLTRNGDAPHILSSGPPRVHGRYFQQRYQKLLAGGAAMFLLALLLVGKWGLDYQKDEVIAMGGNGIRLWVSPFVSEGASLQSQDLAEGVRFSLFYGLSKITGIEVLTDASNMSIISDSALKFDSLKAHLGPTHLLKGSVSSADGMSRVYVQLVEMENGLQQYAGQFDIDIDNRYTSQDEIAENVVNVLRYLLEGWNLEAMKDAGTNNVAAYERYLRAMNYYAQFNPEDFRRSISLFQEAIRLDPEFVNAYYGIALAANNLSARGRSSTVEEMYLLVDSVHRDLLRRGAHKDILNSVNGIKLRMRGFDYAKNEEFLRKLILAGEQGNFAVPHYALMLISARMYDEADRFLELSEVSSDAGLTPDEAWSYRSSIMTPAEMLAVRKWQLLDHPHNVSILSSMVINLGFLDQHEEAQLYLSKLKSLDTEGILYHRSKIMADYFRGAYENDRQAIEDALINDPDYYYNNGLLCFMLGSLDQGVAYWSAIPSAQRRQVFIDLHRSEKFFPPHIVNSERYQRQIELLGNGWGLQRRLMAGVQQMSPVTGIELNLHSSSAYQEDSPMIRNNLWNEAQWSEFHELRDRQFNSNAVTNLD